MTKIHAMLALLSANAAALLHQPRKEIAMKITKLFRAALAITALFVGVTQTAHADIVTWTGDTTDAPRFDRPFADFSDLSGNGENVAYRTHAFTVGEDGDYSLVVSGLGFDTFLFLYAGAFDPAAPLDNGLDGDDDAVSLNTSGFESTLSAGTTYIAVVTGYSSGEFGAYSLTLTGPGLISAVPEPSTWLMLALGLVAVGYAQRRKSLG
jgi:PEP-CTERM motif